MIRQGDKGDGQAEGQGNARTYQMDRFDKASNHEISKETGRKVTSSWEGRQTKGQI